MSIQRFPAVNNSGSSEALFKGSWNADTNTPALANTDNVTAGTNYYVSDAGTVNLGAGNITFEVGDIVIYNGTVWSRIDATDAVVSVAGKSGVITLDKADVGLPNVDNTSDANKPISSATLSALAGKVDVDGAKVLSDNNYTTTEKNKLAGIASGAQVNTVTSVASKTGAVSLVKADVGLPNVDNTSDANKPVSTAQLAALNLKANSANPTFTGTVSGVTKTHVGLPNVPNTDATNASNIGSGILPDARLSANIRRSLVDSFPVDDNIIPSCVVSLAEVAKTYNLPGALTSAPSCIAKVVGLGAQSGQFTARAEVTATDTVTVYYSYNDNSAGTIDIGEKTVYIENTKA